MRGRRGGGGENHACCGRPVEWGYFHSNDYDNDNDNDDSNSNSNSNDNDNSNDNSSNDDDDDDDNDDNNNNHNRNHNHRSHATHRGGGAAVGVGGLATGLGVGRAELSARCCKCPRSSISHQESERPDCRIAGLVGNRGTITRHADGFVAAPLALHRQRTRRAALCTHRSPASAQSNCRWRTGGAVAPAPCKLRLPRRWRRPAGPAAGGACPRPGAAGAAAAAAGAAGMDPQPAAAAGAGPESEEAPAAGAGLLLEEAAGAGRGCLAQTSRRRRPQWWPRPQPVQAAGVARTC